jgi:hypothetical protein
MRENIEFHDSTIIAIAYKGTSLCLSLNAYAHRWDMVAGKWQGTGWVQPVQIIISGGTFEKPPKLPVDLTGGQLRTGQVTCNNMVTLPFMSSEPAVLHLELASGEVFDVSGRDIAIASTGPGRYVEQLPDEFRPRENG